MRRILLAAIAAFVLLCATQSDAQVFHKKKRANKSTSADNTAEPDKILYNRALHDIKRGRHEVGRLGMQTLINTYPDSEYLAKAKLAIADSYYKEAGTANMTQAINGYKDFIVFFPFLEEASYAQLQVAMAHYRQMEKPDRDRSQAKEAETEFQTFLQKYPKDPLAPQAEQRLREVQELLAEGDYRIGYYYYVKGDRRAAAARLLSVANRYPLFTKSDKALWMLGDIFEKSERKEVASLYYAQIVRNYPLSGLADHAKDKLKSFGVPVPQADPVRLAWQQAEQSAPRPHTTLVKRPLALVQSGAGREKQLAARTGQPNLQPEADNTSATDILTGGNQSRIGGTGGGVGSTAVVEIVTPGTSGPAAESDATSSTEGTTAPTGASGNESSPPAAASEPDSGTVPASPGTAPATTSSAGSTAADAPSSAATADSMPKADAAGSDPAQNTDGTNAEATQDAPQKSTDGDSKKESSSKKKKGLRKVIPW